MKCRWYIAISPALEKRGIIGNVSGWVSGFLVYGELRGCRGPGETPGFFYAKTGAVGTMQGSSICVMVHSPGALSKRKLPP